MRGILCDRRAPEKINDKIIMDYCEDGDDVRIGVATMTKNRRGSKK